MFDARGGDRENFGCVQYELILGSTCGVGAVGRSVRGPGRWVGGWWVRHGPRWVIEVVSVAHTDSGIGVLCAVVMAGLGTQRAPNPVARSVARWL